MGEAARSPSFSRCGRAVEASAVEAAAGTLGGGRYIIVMLCYSSY